MDARGVSVSQVLTGARDVPEPPALTQMCPAVVQSVIVRISHFCALLLS